MAQRSDEHPESHSQGKSGAASGQVERAIAPLPALGAAELAAAFSRGLDLAEGKPLGHAQRVCHIALSLAGDAGLDAETRIAIYYAALLHDAGATAASAPLCRLAGINEEALFSPSPLSSPEQVAAELPLVDPPAVLEVMRQHCEEGAGVARKLGLGREVVEAIVCHHERWDGGGYPRGLAGEEIPLAARLVAVADVLAALVASEASPLHARRTAAASLAPFAARALDPELVVMARALVRLDSFWLGYCGGRLQEVILALKPRENGRKGTETLLRYAEVFAGLADGKGEHTRGHSPRTGEWSARLAAASGLAREHVERVALAGLLHDVGMLGVPARIMAKPDILSLAEMQVMRRHPSYSRLILEGLPGLEDVATWVESHHERLDGRGYPEMLEGDAVPLESRIIALAETFVALTSERPYRRALNMKDAQQVLLGAAGSQLDETLVRLFCSLARRAA